MRYLRNLLLLIATALAASAMATASASADSFPPSPVASPNGDNEQDNWKTVTGLKGYRLSVDKTNGFYENCPAEPATTPPPANYSACRTTVTNPANGDWRFDWYWRNGTSLSEACHNSSMTLHFSFYGKTLIYDADWDSNGQMTRCWWVQPADYLTHPSLQTNLSGQICKHVPSGTFWLRQGIVLEHAPNDNEHWTPTFAALSGYPYYFSQTNTYPHGVGLQTDTMSVGTPTQYQDWGGAPDTTPNDWGMSQRIPPVKIANVLITPSASACTWPGLT
jgi:hypothetical protein